MDFAFAENGQSFRLFIDLDPVSTCIHNPPAVVPYPRVEAQEILGNESNNRYFKLSDESLFLLELVLVLFCVVLLA